MRKIFIFPLVAASILVATPAQAGFKLIPQGAKVSVAKSALTVTPSIDWNKMGSRPGRNAESWTLDGLSLNDVTFYGGILNDTTLFKEVNKAEKPLPRFSSNMLPPDIAQLFEASYRIAQSTSLMSIDSMAPATFAGNPGFRFIYSYTVQNEEVKRNGEATGAIIDGKLWMITYEAPAIHYFAQGLGAYHKLVESAVVAAASKKK